MLIPDVTYSHKESRTRPDLLHGFEYLVAGRRTDVHNDFQSLLLQGNCISTAAAMLDVTPFQVNHLFQIILLLPTSCGARAI